MLAMLILPEEAAIISNYLLAQKLNLVNTSFGVAMMQLVNVFNIPDAPDFYDRAR